MSKFLEEDQMERWIEALESDEYVQCQGTLRKFNVLGLDGEPEMSHCCLGVLAEVEGFRNEHGELLYPEHILNRHEEDIIGSFEMFPGVYQEDCYDWNDSQGMTFKEIAANLREALEASREVTQ